VLTPSYTHKDGYVLIVLKNQ